MKFNKIVYDEIQKAKEAGNIEFWEKTFTGSVESQLQGRIGNTELLDIKNEIERQVNSYYNNLKKLSFSQEDYKRLKQTWFNCNISGRNLFIFYLNNVYDEYSLKHGENIIKYLEKTEKRELYEPKETVKFILRKHHEIFSSSQESTSGELIIDNKAIYSASKSLIKTFSWGAELILNVDFFVESCPLCSRYYEVDGILAYCPECDKLELIAYPFLTVDTMYAPPVDETKYEIEDMYEDDLLRWLRDSWDE